MIDCLKAGLEVPKSYLRLGITGRPLSVPYHRGKAGGTKQIIAVENVDSNSSSNANIERTMLEDECSFT